MKQGMLTSTLGVLLLSFTLAVGVANADIISGLVGHWKLDETSGTTAEDSSVNDNHGTLFGDPEWVTGRVRGGLDLDGTNQYVELPIGSLIGSLTNCSVATWVNFSNAGGAWQRVFDFGSNTTYNMFLSPRIETAGAMRFAITIGGSGTPEQRANAPATLPSGWHHVAVTINADSDTIRLYLDGALVAENTSANLTPSDLGNTTQNWLGRSQYSADAYFDGSLDDFRIYNRVLSDADIVELMNWTGGAYAGNDVRVYGGDLVTLSGSGPMDATSWLWEQINTDGKPVVPLDTPTQPTAHFTAPSLEIGTTLDFRLTVNSPTEGLTSDEVTIIVTAVNVPKVAPSNFVIKPLDLPGNELGFRLEWDYVLDAISYQIALKLGSEYFWTYTTSNNYYVFGGMAEGAVRTAAVRGENKFSKPASANPADHGVPSQDVTYTAMPNLARPASLGGTREPLPAVQGVTYVFSRLSIAGMNDRAFADNNDSNNSIYKPLDFWGYVWNQQYFFDHIVYYTGQFGADGGWFTSLKIQYTTDGTTWKDAPIVDIIPDYDFTDAQGARKNFTRYDLIIPTLRGTGIRIAGTPGGSATFSSISELEVYGDQTQGPLIVQGLDADYPEGGTASLDGSMTFSTAGAIASYKWEFVSGPSTPTIQNSTSVVATFEAPNVASDQVFVFKLTAGDGTNTGSDADVRITVKNLVTTSVAGPDQKVYEGTTATLDGSGSLSTTGNLTYLWTQTAGTDMGVTGKTTATVQFTAPIIWGYTEDMTFQLKVDDGASGISTDEVQVQVRNTLAAPIYPLGPGYMKDLLHLGVSPRDRILSPLGIDTDQLAAFGGQAMVNPLEDDAYDFTGTGVTGTRNPMVWTPQHDATGFFGDEGLDNFIQYYHVYIISPEQRDARAIFRHDDEMRCWNNGALAFMRNSWDGDPGDVAIERSADFTLFKGINSMTLKFHEGGGGNYLAVRFTDRSDVEYTDLYYAFGPSIVLADAYAARTLPLAYQPGATTDVSLSFKVNPNNKPTSVTVQEKIPTGLTEADVVAPGAVIAGGNITWTLTGAQLNPSTINYSLKVPAGTAQSLDFEGTVSFATTSTDIFGDSTVYAVPTEPRYLEVEMLTAAHLTWVPPLTEGTGSYRIERSVNGGAWQEIGITAGTSFLDSAVTAGNNYSYRVAASNVRGAEGPFSDPTDQASLPTMLIREAEDFNYGDGQYPGYQNCPAATEAPTANAVDPQYDFWHPDKGGPRDYRPNDAIGIWTATEPGTTTQNSGIGWIDPGSWWRYTFDVPEPGPQDPPGGWVRIVFRIGQLANQASTVTAYWDEKPVGTISIERGPSMTFVYPTIDHFQTEPGLHTLRVEARGATAGLDVFDFDKIAIGFNWSAPKRKAIWSDNFDTYSATAEVKATGGWDIVDNSNPQDDNAAWQLWDTEDDLGSNPGNLEGMNDKYMVSNSDFAPSSQLDEDLLSPEVDCMNYRRIRLNFNKNFTVYPADPEDDPQVGEVDIRVYDAATGWGDWVNVFHIDKSMIDPALEPADDVLPEQIDLSAYDGEKIQLRWRFFDVFFDYWFAIDEVRVSGLPLPPTKGKVTGVVLAAGKVALTWTAFGPGQYTVQYTEDLVGGTWTSVAGMPTTATTWAGEDIAGIPGKRYYRVMAPSQ